LQDCSYNDESEPEISASAGMLLWLR